MKTRVGCATPMQIQLEPSVDVCNLTNHMNNKNDINEHKQSKQFIIKQYKKKEIFKQKKM